MMPLPLRAWHGIVLSLSAFVVALAVVSSVGSCSEVPTSTTPTITWSTPDDVPAALLKQLNADCAQLGIPPPRVVLAVTPAPVVGISVDGFKTLRGHFSTRTKLITLFVFLPEQVYLDHEGNLPTSAQGLGQLLLALRHELLHYFDDLTGAPDVPEDHQQLFYDRMRALGWLR